MTEKIKTQNQREQSASQKNRELSVRRGAGFYFGVYDEMNAAANTKTQQPQRRWYHKISGWVCEVLGFLNKYSTFIIMLATLGTVTVAYWQWSTMREETAANQMSARVAEGQLAEMRTSSADTKAVAEAAKQSARVAEQTLVLSQRPWVATALALDGPFEWTLQGEGRLRVKFTGVNVGNSVADGTEVFMEMSPLLLSQKNIGESMRRQKALCEKIKKERSQAQGGFGFALFPHEQMEWTSPVIMKKEDIDSAGARMDPRLPKNWVSPILVGCVIYRFTFSQEYHATGFIYQISRLIPNDPDAGGMIELNQTVPLTNLQMQPFSVGGSSRYAD